MSTETKSQLVEILDRISIADGRITLANLSDESILALQNLVVWSYKDRRSLGSVLRFGDTDYRPENAKKAVVIDTGSLHLDFEIKSVLLMLLHLGLKEGGKNYKWISALHRIRTLLRFAAYCKARRIPSFRTLETLSPVKLKTLLIGFLNDRSSDGGLDAARLSSGYKTFLDGLKHLADFGVVSRPDFRGLVGELTSANVVKHETENRLKHSIIPTGVMKHLIVEAEAYVNMAAQKLPQLEGLIRQTNKAIAVSGCSVATDAIGSVERVTSKQLHKLIQAFYKDLARNVYALVLAFTGMRDNEALALETDSAGKKTENGEDLFFVRSLLSKTDDNQIWLDWVANELAYKAISVLSAVNRLFYERAELFLSHYRDRLTPKELHQLQLGLKERRLFGIRFIYSFTSFIWTTRGTDKQSGLSLRSFQIPVKSADIDQLEQLECNHKSVSRNSGFRGTPYQVGDLFNFTAHQFRHTFAWFIIANRLGDIDDIKYQFKHLHRAMTMVYGERGYKSLSELQEVIEYFETLVNRKSIEDIVNSSLAGHIAGGGGERLSKMLSGLNEGEDGVIYGQTHQAHFRSTRDVVAFATRHSESVRGLPHGYCTKGRLCEIKNAADPSHCLYCETYYATLKHLPYWRAIKINCETKLERIAEMPGEAQEQFAVFKQTLEDNLFAANKVISELEPPAGDVEIMGS